MNKKKILDTCIQMKNFHYLRVSNVENIIEFLGKAIYIVSDFFPV